VVSIPPRIDGSVVGSDQPAAHRRVEHRLGFPALAGGQLSGAHPERVLQRAHLGQHGQVVGVIGHLQGARLPVADRLAADSLEFGGEGRVAAQGLAAEREQLAFGVGRLGDRCQHACRRVGRALAGVRVGHDHAQALLRGSPGGGQADYAAADDDDVGVLTGLKPDGRLPSPA
jgi:hypothetical protein